MTDPLSRHRRRALADPEDPAAREALDREHRRVKKWAPEADGDDVLFDMFWAPFLCFMCAEALKHGEEVTDEQVAEWREDFARGFYGGEF